MYDISNGTAHGEITAYPMKMIGHGNVTVTVTHVRTVSFSNKICSFTEHCAVIQEHEAKWNTKHCK